MLIGRTCKGTSRGGEPCRTAPLREHDYCLFHSPDHAEEAAEARRLGGQRRRRERVVTGAFDIEGLDSVPQLQRILQIAVSDALGLENSIARVRALAALVQVAAKLLEVGELADRLAALEATMRPRGPLRAVGGRR